MRGGDRILVAILRGQLRQISREVTSLREMAKCGRRANILVLANILECLYTKIQNTKTRAIIKV